MSFPDAQAFPDAVACRLATAASQPQPSDGVNASAWTLLQPDVCQFDALLPAS